MATRLDMDPNSLRSSGVFDSVKRVSKHAAKPLMFTVLGGLGTGVVIAANSRINSGPLASDVDQRPIAAQEKISVQEDLIQFSSVVNQYLNPDSNIKLLNRFNSILRSGSNDEIESHFVKNGATEDDKNAAIKADKNDHYSFYANGIDETKIPDISVEVRKGLDSDQVGDITAISVSLGSQFTVGQMEHLNVFNLPRELSGKPWSGVGTFSDGRIQESRTVVASDGKSYQQVVTDPGVDTLIISTLIPQ